MKKRVAAIALCGLMLTTAGCLRMPQTKATTTTETTYVETTMTESTTTVEETDPLDNLKLIVNDISSEIEVAEMSTRDGLYLITIAPEDIGYDLGLKLGEAIGDMKVSGELQHDWLISVFTVPGEVGFESVNIISLNSGDYKTYSPDFSVTEGETIEAEETTETEPVETTMSVPLEYKTALQSARDYMEYVGGYSKQRLYDQLLYEDFPPEAAQYAVDIIFSE